MHCSTPLKKPLQSFIPKMQVKRLVEDDLNSSNELQIDMGEKSPLRNITNLCDDRRDILFTPKKSKIDCSSPGTPTCNMKLLTRVAASLEYVKSVDKENKKETTQTPENSGESKLKRTPSLSKSRKEKSISVICEKFISEFPEYPDPNTKIPVSLTEAANRLGVEKRRVYDIVNILESVEMVKKSCKNEYLWCGKTELVSMLQSLKNLALLNGLDKILRRAVLTERGSHLVYGICMKETLPPQFFAAFKKEKSLGTLARQFLSLFLTEEKPLVISLTVAAQLLLGNTECMPLSKKKTEFKTKVRRLYDVANVLAPLRILKRENKKHGCSSPSFRYCGPSLIHNFLGLKTDGIAESQNSTSKLDYLNTFQLLPAPKCHSTDIFSRTKSENWHLKHETPAKKFQPFQRHSSLQDVCNAAEIEHNRLFGSISSQLFNENSTDSSLSFLSYSTETSLSENHFDDLKYSEKTMQASALLRDTQDLTTFESSSDDCRILSGKDNEVPRCSQVIPSEYCKMQQVLQLTQEQQTTVLNYLNVTCENGQVALLLIPNDQNNNHLEGDTGPKKKIILPMSLFTNLKNQQAKQNTLPYAANIFSPLLKISSNTLPEHSSAKSNQADDSAKKQLVTVVCDKENVKTLKLLPIFEPSVLPKHSVPKTTSILQSNSYTHSAENNADRSAVIKRQRSGSVDSTNSTLNFTQTLSPVSFNKEGQRNEPLNGCVAKQKLTCGTCGSENIKLVDATGNMPTTKNPNRIAAIKEKVVTSPITVHLKKSVETPVTFSSPKTPVRKQTSLIILKKPKDKGSRNDPAKNL